MKRITIYIVCSLGLIWHPILFATVVTLRDPTQPAIADTTLPEIKVQEKKEEIILQGIIVSSKRRLALINDHYVKVGDMIGEDKVESIEKNSILLSRSGQKRTIYLFSLDSWEDK